MRGRDFTRSYGELPGVGIDLDHFYHIRAAVDHLIGEGDYAENFLQAMEELAPNWNEPLPEAASNNKRKGSGTKHAGCELSVAGGRDRRRAFSLVDSTCSGVTKPRLIAKACQLRR